MLVTTGKNPDNFSRKVARAIACAVPGSRLESRGRRALYSLIFKARKLHFTRVCVVYREQGMPHTVSFLSISDGKAWKWLSPKIRIRKIISAAKPPKRSRPGSLKITGEKSAPLRRLLSLPRMHDGENCAVLAAGAGKLSFSIGGKRIIELGVRYEK